MVQEESENELFVTFSYWDWKLLQQLVLEELHPIAVPWFFIGGLVYIRYVSATRSIMQ